MGVDTCRFRLPNEIMGYEGIVSAVMVRVGMVLCCLSSSLACRCTGAYALYVVKALLERARLNEGV